MKKYRIIWGVAIGVLIALLVGAMLSFYPLIGMKVVYREIAFCTFIICMVIAICTHITISHIKSSVTKRKWPLASSLLERSFPFY